MIQEGKKKSAPFIISGKVQLSGDDRNKDTSEGARCRCEMSEDVYMQLKQQAKTNISCSMLVFYLLLGSEMMAQLHIVR